MTLLFMMSASASAFAATGASAASEAIRSPVSADENGARASMVQNPSSYARQQPSSRCRFRASPGTSIVAKQHSSVQYIVCIDLYLEHMDEHRAPSPAVFRGRR